PLLRKRAQAVGRFVVFLLVGSVLAFGLVLRMPLTPILLSNQSTEASEPADNSKPPKPLHPPKHTSPARRISTRTYSRRQNAVETQSNTPLPVQDYSTIASSNNRQVTRLTDDSAVYAFNSPASDVVKLLKKGDVVDPLLEVVDARGRWTL